MSNYQAGPPVTPIPPSGPPLDLRAASRKHWLIALTIWILMAVWYFGVRFLLPHLGSYVLTDIFRWGVNASFVVGGHLVAASIATAIVLRLLSMANGYFHHNPYLASRGFLYFVGAAFLLVVSYICRYVLPMWVQRNLDPVLFYKLLPWVEMVNSWLATPLAFALLTAFFMSRALGAKSGRVQQQLPPTPGPHYPAAY